MSSLRHYPNSELPPLGVGIVYSPGLESLLSAGHDLIDVIEIEPQQFWFDSRSTSRSHKINRHALELISHDPRPKIVHSVGCPVGGTAPDSRHWEPLADSIQLLQAPWASEHLSFNRTVGRDGPFQTGFLLPPIQSTNAVEVAVSNILQLKSMLKVPFAFETGVSYLQPISGEMSDGAFIAAVADGADCGIVLDLHNLWTNERNGRQSVVAVLDEIPLDRVWEMHLAGGDQFDGYWIDSHSGIVPAEVINLAITVAPSLPNLKAIIFEIVAEHVSQSRLSMTELVDQIGQLHSIYERRGSGLSRSGDSPMDAVGPASISEPLPAPQAWEQALGNVVTGFGDSGQLALQLMADPGTTVLRKLVEAVRAGMIVDSLMLTSRYIMLTLGEPAFRHLLEAFWRSARPESFASEECLNFGSFLRGLALDVPHLYDVLMFELARQEVVMDGLDRVLKLRCDPRPLLAALAHGHLPEHLDDREFELEILARSS
jgi:uncharacterized protein